MVRAKGTDLIWSQFCSLLDFLLQYVEREQKQRNQWTIPFPFSLSLTHTHRLTHRHYYCSLISNPWENAAAVCTGKLGITVNLLCTKSTRSDSESLQVRASCVALYSSPAEGKRQGCYPALYPHPLSLPLSLLHPGHRQIKPSGWSRKTMDPGGWTQTSRRVAVAESPGLHSRRTPRLDAAFSFLSCFQPHIACRGQTPDFL